MNNVIGARAPGWLRIVAALALVWNLIGVYFYLASVGMVPAPDPAMAAENAAQPAWVTGTFAVCVFAGTLGSLGLLMLKSWSKLLLLLSLIAIVVQNVYVFLLRPGGHPDIVLPTTVFLIGLFLAVLSARAAKRGWLS